MAWQPATTRNCGQESLADVQVSDVSQEHHSCSYANVDIIKGVAFSLRRQKSKPRTHPLLHRQLDALDTEQNGADLTPDLTHL